MASPDHQSKMMVKTSRFGEVAIADGDIILMDGGIHGVQGHTLSLAASNHATWERTLDGMRPQGRAGRGALVLAAADAALVRGWAEGSWQLAPQGEVSYRPPFGRDVPRWSWVIVLRQGDEVRVLNGAGWMRSGEVPEPASQLLVWLRTRVDAASEDAPQDAHQAPTEGQASRREGGRSVQQPGSRQPGVQSGKSLVEFIGPAGMALLGCGALGLLAFLASRCGA